MKYYYLIDRTLVTSHLVGIIFVNSCAVNEFVCNN